MFLIRKIKPYSSYIPWLVLVVFLFGLGLGITLRILLPSKVSKAVVYNWTTTIIDSSVYIPYSAPMVLNSSDQPRVAYTDQTNNYLVYSACNSNCTTAGNWTSVNIDKSRSGINVADMVLDGSNNPHIAYSLSAGAPGDVFYATCTANCTSAWEDDGAGGTCSGTASDNKHDCWTIETVDTAPTAASAYLAITVDSSNVPRIIHFNESSDYLVYADRTGGSWTVINLDKRANNYPGEGGVAIKINSSGNPVITYSENSDDLWYGTCTANCTSAWEDDGAGGTCSGTASDNLHDCWTLVEILNDADSSFGYVLTSEFNSKTLVLSNTDVHHLAHVRRALAGGGGGSIRYSTCSSSCTTPGNWTTNELIDGSSVTMKTPAIALDNNNKPIISYRDHNNHDLKYAARVGSGGGSGCEDNDWDLCSIVYNGSQAYDGQNSNVDWHTTNGAPVIGYTLSSTYGFGFAEANVNDNPTNDSLDLLSHADGEEIFAGQNYTWQVVVSDIDGYANLSTVVLHLDHDGDNQTITWTQATNAFSTSSAYFTNNSSSSSCAANTCTLSFNLTMDWDWTNTDDTATDAQVVTTDDVSGSDSDIYLTDTFQLENDLRVTGITYDSTQNPSVSFTVTGYLDYEGVTTPNPGDVADIRIDPSWTLTNYDDTSLDSNSAFSISVTSDSSLGGIGTFDVDIISAPSGASTVSTDSNAMDIDRAQITAITISNQTYDSAREWDPNTGSMTATVSARLEDAGTTINAGTVTLVSTSYGGSASANISATSATCSSGSCAVTLNASSYAAASNIATYDDLYVSAVSADSNDYGTAVRHSAAIDEAGERPEVGWDAQAPTGTTLGFGTINTTSIGVTVSGATDGSGSGLSAAPYYFDRNNGAASSGWQSGAAWTDTSLAINTQYTYKVRAQDRVGNNSDFTATQSKYTYANAPATPSISSPTVSSLNVVVSVNSNPAATEFAIYETTTLKYVQTGGSLDTNEAWQTYANWGGASGKIVTGLTQDTTYIFKVKAKNGDNVETAFSNTSSGYTSPGAPSNFQAANVSANSVDLSVNAFSNDNVGQAGYYFARTAPTTANSGWQSGDNTWTDSGLSANTQYTHTVQYRDSGGTTGGTATLTTYTLVSAPTNLGLTPSANSIAASATAFTNDNVGSSGYYFSQAGANSGWQRGNNTWTDASVLANTQYTYNVKYRNGDGTETSTYSSSAYTLANTPTSLTLTPGVDSFAVSVPAFNNDSAGSSGYYFARTSPTTANSGWQSGDNTWTDSGLSANTQYTYTVKYRNNDATETSTYSSSAYTSINTPTGITWGTITATSITMSASGSLVNLSQGSSGLYLDETSGNTGATDSGWLQVNSFTDSGLSPNTLYTYRVKARNGDAAETSYTTAVSQYTYASIPATPTVNGATNSTLNVTINVNSNPAATEFAIQETNSSNYVQTNGTLAAGAIWRTYANWGGASGVTVTGLESGGTYSFRVKAKNSDGTETDFSSSATGSLIGRGSADITPPSKPANPQITLTSDNQVKLTWADPSEGDFNSIIILKGKAPGSISASPYATVAKGVQKYLDKNLSTGTYKYLIRATDTSGNATREETEISITVPEATTSETPKESPKPKASEEKTTKEAAEELKSEAQSLVVDENNVALWHFEKGSELNILADSTASKNDGVLKNFDTSTAWQEGKVGVNSLEFDGLGDYVEVPLSDELKNFSLLTIEAWLKPFYFPEKMVIVSDKHPRKNWGGYQLDTSYSKLCFSFWSEASSDNNQVCADGLKAGFWQKIAVTYDSNKELVALFIDGQLKKTGLIRGKPVSFYPSDLKLNIGRQISGQDYFKGFIDEVRISKIARDFGVVVEPPMAEIMPAAAVSTPTPTALSLESPLIIPTTETLSNAPTPTAHTLTALAAESVKSSDHKLNLNLPKGAVKDNQTLTIHPVPIGQVPPHDSSLSQGIVGEAYNILLIDKETGKPLDKFSEPIEIKFEFDRESIKKKHLDLRRLLLTHYDTSLNKWVALCAEVDLRDNSLKTTSQKTGMYAIQIAKDFVTKCSPDGAVSADVYQDSTLADHGVIVDMIDNKYVARLSENYLGRLGKAYQVVIINLKIKDPTLNIDRGQLAKEMNLNFRFDKDYVQKHGIDPANLALVYYNPESRVWVKLAHTSIYFDQGYFLVKTRELGVYAIILEK